MSIEDTQSEIIEEYQNLLGGYYNGLKARGFDLKESLDDFWRFNEEFGIEYERENSDEDNERESYKRCEQLLEGMSDYVQELKEFIAEDGLIFENGMIEDWKNPDPTKWTEMDIIARKVFESLSQMISCDKHPYWSYSNITFDKEQVECVGSCIINSDFPLSELCEHIDKLFITIEGIDITSGDWEPIDRTTTSKVYESPNGTYQHKCTVKIERMVIHSGWYVTLNVA